MKEWGDAKTNIFEHIILSSLIFFFALFWDHFVHLAHAININLVPKPDLHPFSIGAGQIIAMALSAIHFARKLNEWRYYGNVLPEKLKEMVRREI